MSKTLITSLTLTDFRSFHKTEFEFDPEQTLVLGDNGRGKTNILESINLLSTGRSFQGKSLSECVRLGTEVAHIEAKTQVDGEDLALTLAILAKENHLGQRSSTRYQKNGVKKRRGDVVGLLKSVGFLPEDLDLVTGAPSLKREYLNDCLVQVSGSYAHALSEYERALKHRNKLILQLREGTVTRRDFLFWDELLIRHGDTILRQRKAFMHFLNECPFPLPATTQYDYSVIDEERLHKYAEAEVAAGKTLVGPHKDNFTVEVKLNGDGFSDVSLYGSRGQQRLAVLWLKLAELLYIEKETGIQPILLLDDIFSELDDHNREIIFPLFADHQVILTSAEQIDVLPPEAQVGKLIEL